MNRDEAAKHLARVAADAEVARRAKANERADAWTTWLIELQNAEIDQGGDTLDADDVMAAGLAGLQGAIDDVLDRRFAETEGKARDEAAELRRRFDELQTEHTSVKQRHLAEIIGLKERADHFERQARESTEAIAEMRKGLATLQIEVSKERAMRRLTEARRTRPHDQAVAAELARRQAAKAKKDNSDAHKRREN